LIDRFGGRAGVRKSREGLRITSVMALKKEDEMQSKGVCGLRKRRFQSKGAKRKNIAGGIVRGWHEKIGMTKDKDRWVLCEGNRRRRW